MSSISDVSTSSSSDTSPPRSPSMVRLKSKIDVNKMELSPKPLKKWSERRLVTPDQAIGLQSPLGGLQYVNGTVQLFFSGQNSQGLIEDESGQVMAASVTTSIKTATKRKEEKKSTHVQYDKSRFKQKGADFQVDETNARKQINYQGGHLIDHKYSAAGSHTTEANYIPQHCMLNAPIKEYLVQRSEAYVEIPLYAQVSPTVGVKGKQNDEHQIPVGDVFVQINQEKIDNVYYFPNNFNYEALKASLDIKKNLAATIVPYFKLKPCFHPLFQSAVVTDFRNHAQGKLKQEAREKEFLKMIDGLSDGIALEESGVGEEEIQKLAFAVFHNDGSVSPSLLLNCDKEMYKKIRGPSLALPFKILGGFLVTYGIRNALKSEVISINARLIFLNVLIDFIEASSTVEPSAIAFVDGLALEFKKSFIELEKIQPTMGQRELFYFADTYRRLSSKGNHSFFEEGHEICFLELEEVLPRFVGALQQITQTYPIHTLTSNFVDSLLGMACEVQDTIEYWVETGFPAENYEQASAFLCSIRKQCLDLFDDSPADRSNTTYRSNIRQYTTQRALPKYLRSRLENLGKLEELDTKEHFNK